MDSKTALPIWIIFLLVALGIAMAVGVALLLTQLDTLQQRSLLPQATLPVIDQEATLAAGEVTVVVIAGDELQTNTPTPSPTITPQIVEEGTPTQTAVPVLIPTCSAAPQDWSPYVIRAGDTAESLALKHGISIISLMQANCLTIEPLSPGQVILLPLSTPTPATEVACGAPSGWVQYTVKPGDTLAGLAEQRNTSALLIMNANCLEETNLEPGRTIFLPPLPPMHTMPTATRPKPRPPTQWTPARPAPTRPIWPTATATFAVSTPTLAPTSSATSTNEPSAVPSSIPTKSGSPTPPPTSTVTVAPTATPVPPTVTAVPPTATTSPTETPMNTSTPVPTATAEGIPSQTPASTNTPVPPVPTATSVNPYPYPGQASLPTPTATATPISYP